VKTDADSPGTVRLSLVDSLGRSRPELYHHVQGLLSTTRNPQGHPQKFRASESSEPTAPEGAAQSQGAGLRRVPRASTAGFVLAGRPARHGGWRPDRSPAPLRPSPDRLFRCKTSLDRAGRHERPVQGARSRLRHDFAAAAQFGHCRWSKLLAPATQARRTREFRARPRHRRVAPLIGASRIARASSRVGGPVPLVAGRRHRDAEPLMQLPSEVGNG
jgi:hypothetical protein